MVMGIKIFIVAAVMCSLISVSSAVAGMAGHADSFVPSKKCPNIKETGTYAAAVNSQFFSMNGFDCGTGIRVMCGINGKKPYCKHGKFIDVKIVEECSPEQCPGGNDMVLSKEAFTDIANIQEQKIGIGWTDAVM